MSFKLITNWPAHCPKCSCREFEVSSKTRLIMPSGSRSRHVQNRLVFTCLDSSCLESWVETLVGFDPWISLPTETSPAMAVVAASEEVAKELIRASGTLVPLSTLFREGSENARRANGPIDASRTDQPGLFDGVPDK